MYMYLQSLPEAGVHRLDSDRRTRPVPVVLFLDDENSQDTERRAALTACLPGPRDIRLAIRSPIDRAGWLNGNGTDVGERSCYAAGERDGDCTRSRSLTVSHRADL